jgi:O-antigen/teichoic acid export membrane protein
MSAVAEPASQRGVSVRRIARNTGSQVAAEVAGRLAMLGFWALLAREFGQSGFGEFTLALSVVVFINVASLGTDFVVTREIARSEEHMHALFWNTNAVKLGAGTVGLGIVLAFTFLGGYSAETRVVIAILAVATLLDLLGRTSESAFRGLEDMVPIALSRLIQRVSTTAAAALAIALGAGIVTVAFIYLGGVAISVAYLAIWLFRRAGWPRLRVSSAGTRSLLTASLPLALGFAFGAALARIDTVILSLLKSSVDVGLYGAAYRLFESSLFVQAIFGISIYPVLSRLTPTTTPTIGEAYEKACKFTAVTLFPLGMTFVLFAAPIVHLLYGPYFDAAAAALRLLGVATAFWGFFGLATFVLASQDRQDVIAWLIGGGVALNIALNFGLIPEHTFRGAAAAMALTLIAIDLVAAWRLRALTGRVSWLRVGLGPLVGCAAMAGVRLALGAEVAVIPVALVAGLGVTYVVERWVYPDDLRGLVSAIRRPAPASAETV